MSPRQNYEVNYIFLYCWLRLSLQANKKMVEWNQSLKLFPHRWRSLQERWFLQRASDNEIETVEFVHP